ncbi:Thiol-disulfide oxidoreductase ResA [Arenibacter antarcticus]|uniref:TlpA family protein disulfide reductase n=1 Tax=Arenibacter antarcticus TaxID=2040469 RepID=A0ABW5VIA5_9FLAO|nr:TlpA disulfide reductase family protein [Arenibacter sp. H213]MCM4167152.1 thioredoxin [Arenibacter sp. H213]
MNKKIKKEILQWVGIIAVGLILYTTGLHTEVIGFAQRGILATGIMNPNVDKKDLASNDTSYPSADFGLNLVNSKGESLSLEKFRGKAIFINVWATWCPPCIAEMPNINELYNELKDDNVEFIMLSVDDSFEKAKSFSERKGYDFEIYTPNGPLPQMYHSNSIPTTYIIDAKGNLVLTHKGMGNYSTKKFTEFMRDLQ